MYVRAAVKKHWIGHPIIRREGFIVNKGERIPRSIRNCPGQRAKPGQVYLPEKEGGRGQHTETMWIVRKRRRVAGGREAKLGRAWESREGKKESPGDGTVLAYRDRRGLEASMRFDMQLQVYIIGKHSSRSKEKDSFWQPRTSSS